MTASEYKSLLALEVANQNVNMLLNALADARAHIDDFKANLTDAPIQ